MYVNRTRCNPIRGCAFLSIAWPTDGDDCDAIREVARWAHETDENYFFKVFLSRQLPVLYPSDETDYSARYAVCSIINEADELHGFR
jgi:hypothetical protein